MKLIRRLILCAGLLLAGVSLGGCLEFAGGVAGGVAASETFADWQRNLEAKKAELQQQYDQVLAELQTAPDPNAVRTARDKLAAIADSQLVNEGALLATRAALNAPSRGSPAQEQQDFWAAVLVGAIGIGYQTLTKRTLSTKYIAMKEGQARLKLVDPEAEAKLYTQVGVARAGRGL